MILFCKHKPNDAELAETARFLTEQGVTFHQPHQKEKQLFIIQNKLSTEKAAWLQNQLPNWTLSPTAEPFVLAARSFNPIPTSITINETIIGGTLPFIIAGPCAVENEEQIYSTAAYLASRGIKLLRGGAFKPRTSPYSFQGLKHEGLKLLSAAGVAHQMGIVTELLDLKYLDAVYEHTDIIQVGTRNMFNYELLRELGRQDKPVLLKRGFSARIEEWLLAAEYILLGGNDQVILCERGIRTFETELRNTLDLEAVALVKELSHLPVITDPSQATGRKSLIGPMVAASLAAGANGVMVEVHPKPEQALSDGPQSLNFKMFDEMLVKLSETYPGQFKMLDIEKNSINFTSSN